MFLKYLGIIGIINTIKETIQQIQTKLQDGLRNLLDAILDAWPSVDMAFCLFVIIVRYLK